MKMTSNSKKNWEDLVLSFHSETRSLENDSVVFLHNTNYFKQLTSEEKDRVTKIVEISINEPFIYFERLLLLGNYYMRKKNKNGHSMKLVDNEEVRHLNAFRVYNLQSAQSQMFYKSKDGSIIKPGEVVKHHASKRHKLAVFLVKNFPECIYPIALLFEQFSVDVGLTLIKDHGKNSKDSFVRLHYQHLKDEAKHLIICESKMKEVFSKIPKIMLPLYLLVNTFLVFHFLSTPFLNLKIVKKNCPNLSRNILFQFEFYCASIGIKRKGNPFSTTFYAWSRKMIYAFGVA